MAGGTVDISVVIATRNRASWLDACLRTVSEQRTDARFEVIVVDNASEDGTPEVIDGWRRRDERFRGMREDRLGRSAALNRGIAEAAGSVIAFTDDDVLVDEGWIQAYVSLFAAHPDAEIAGGPIYPIPRTERWPRWYDDVAASSIGAIDYDGERPLGDRENVWGANMAVRPSLFARIGTWGEDLGVRGAFHPNNADPSKNEDTEFQQRASAAGSVVWFCPGAKIRHRVNVPSPRVCLGKGVSNGMSSWGRPPWPTSPRDRRRGRHSLGGALALAGALVRIVWWAAALRLRPTSWVFRRAWLAAWNAGWRLEDLTGGNRSTSTDVRIRVLAFGPIRLAQRLAPWEP